MTFFLYFCPDDSLSSVFNETEPLALNHREPDVLPQIEFAASLNQVEKFSVKV